jgi:hypothetical protein
LTGEDLGSIEQALSDVTVHGARYSPYRQQLVDSSLSAIDAHRQRKRP